MWSGEVQAGQSRQTQSILDKTDEEARKSNVRIVRAGDLGVQLMGAAPRRMFWSWDVTGGTLVLLERLASFLTGNWGDKQSQFSELRLAIEGVEIGECGRKEGNHLR